jgi:hypothetical protein
MTNIVDVANKIKGLQTEKQKRTAAILAAHKHGEYLAGDDLEFMRSVFEADPRYPDKPIITNIKVAHARKPYGMRMCFWVQADGREFEPWSFKKALQKPAQQAAKVAP